MKYVDFNGFRVKGQFRKKQKIKQVKIQQQQNLLIKNIGFKAIHIFLFLS